MICDGGTALPVAASGLGLATVAICTHNRTQDVSRCLGALVKQARLAGFPVVVADSASDPAPAAELRRLADVHGARYLRIESSGLSVARNAARRVAGSEWIVFLDDDAIPDPDWARWLVTVLSAASPEVAIVGGKIRPGWPDGVTPEHVTDRWKALLSCVDREGTGLVRDGYNVCGANLAVRCAALEQAGGFPPALGRVGSHLISGEESFLIERFADLGFQAMYDEAFAVEHSIRRDRLQLGWVMGRAYWEGVTRIRVLRALHRPFPRDLGVAKLALSLFVLTALRWLSSSPDYPIRYHMARGSLVDRVRSLLL